MSRQSHLVSDPAARVLLERYYAGACSPAEVLHAEQLLEAYPTEGQVVNAFRTEPVVEPPSADEREAVFHAIMATVEKGDLTRTARERRPSGALQRAFLASVTALSLAIGGWWISASRRGALPARTYATTIGQRLTVTLGDGSRIVLAPDTKLQLTAFNATTRTVSLFGQASFHVAAAAKTPFIVRTGSVTTRVLGTTFDVKHYDADTVVRVVVTDGEVVTSVNPSKRGASSYPKRVILASGDVAYATDSAITATTANDLSGLTSWTAGRLVFRDTPAGDVLATVGRWYGIEFRLADPALAHIRVTVSFDYPARSMALAAVRELLSVNLTFDGNHAGIPIVTLHPQSIQTRPHGLTRREARDSFMSPTFKEAGR